MSFLEGECVYLNQNVQKYLPYRVGELATINRNLFESKNYDYTVIFEDGTHSKVRESELNKLTDKEKQLVQYIYKGSKVLYNPTNEEVYVRKVDLVHGQIEIDFIGGGSSVVGIESLKRIDEKETEQPQIESLGKFTEIAFGIGEFTDMKNKQYGSSVDATYEMIKVLMERYKNDDNTYTIPEILLQHILLQVRMMDKINRVFNNPSGEGDSESPYKDLCGYSLIGIDMVNR